MKRVSIGGQAVLEGVMMKGPKSYALAVRKPNKEIEVKVTDYVSLGERYKALQIPIIRGIVNFLESLYIGMKTLMDSSEFVEEEESTGTSSSGNEAADKKTNEESGSSTAYLVGTLIVSLIIAVGVFMLLPAFIANFLYKLTDSDLLVINQHGNNRRNVDLAPAVGLLLEAILQIGHGGRKILIELMRLLSRVLLIPLIAGISYEFIRYAGKHNNACSNVLSAPGLWVQRLTTKEPDDSMIEVAIKSVEGVIDWHEYVDAVRNNSFES